MRKLTCLSSAVALSAALAAQGTLTTSTNYGDWANAGNGQVSGVPARTQVGTRGLHVTASDTDRTTGAAAMAATDVTVGPGKTNTSFVTVVGEKGTTAARAAQRGGAGTSSDHQTATPGPHDLLWSIPGRAGSTATVMVGWNASASANASAGVAVDVDSDGTADFAHRVSGGRNQQQQSFTVKVGSNGSFDIAISTSGNVGFGGAGVETYAAVLAVSFDAGGGGGGQCTFTNFGRPCGGSLAGSASSSSGGAVTAAIQLSGAAANAVAALAIGSPLGTPIQLPGSQCSLLVNPMVVLPGRTDAQGNGGWKISFRPQSGLTASFQAVTLSLTGGGATLASSDGLTMVCP